MCYQCNRHYHKYPPSAICTLVFHQTAVLLLLTLCGAQAEMIGSSTPILAMIGEDIILPCRLQPGSDVSPLTLEWARLDLDPRFVHLRRDGVELPVSLNPSYIGRTSLSTEKLKQGDLSLTLSKVKLSDEGKYRCHIPDQGTSIVELVVDDVCVASSGSATCIIVVLSTGFLVLSVLFFVLWRLRKNRGKEKMHHEKDTPKGRGRKQPVVDQIGEKLEEKEEEKNDMQHVISILEEQRKELESTRNEHILKLKKVEEEWMENEKKNKKLSKQFRWDKDTTESPLLKLKMELENKKREYKTYLESTEIKIQKSTDMITKIEDRKKKVENQIDEIKKDLNGSKMKQVEGERGENKTKLQKVKNVEQQTKPKEMKPLLETKIEVENEKKETKKPLDRIEKNIQKSTEAISLQQEQEQETEPERTGAEQRPKQKKEEKEKGENKKKLLKVKNRSHKNKDDKTKSESKIELENEKTEHKSLFDSIDKNMQESMDMISILKEQKTGPENSGAEQRPKQKKEEKEKGEKKMKLPKLTNPFHRSEHESKIELENKKTERENLLDLAKNVQEMTVLAGGIRQSIQSGLETQEQTD